MLPMRKHEKNREILEATSLLSEMRPGLFLVIGIMLLGSDIYSLFPLYSTMAILVITYAILFLPYTAEYLISDRYLTARPQSPLSCTQKNSPLRESFFHSADAEIILRS